MTDPITLTLPELAERWNTPAPQVLSRLLQQALPLYFYFDGLVFNFGDKWLRAGGDVRDVQDLEAQQERLSTAEIDRQRQNLHQLGLLKLTQWEEALSPEALQQLRAEVGRLGAEVERLTTRLRERTSQRQRQVRNGLLRAAPRTLQEIVRHGRATFPQFAFLPNAADGTDGALVALEDGFPLMSWLGTTDLVVAMGDVKAAESC